MTYQCIETSEGLVLKCQDTPHEKPLRVNFSDPSLQYRVKRVQHEALIKAIKVKHRTPLNLFDATAGLGTDAFLMAAAGHHVTLVEKHPLVYRLLKDGMTRAAQCAETQSIVQRMTLLHGDSLEVLAQTQQTFDVIYMDPMFPEKKKNAASKKEMRALQALVEQQDNLEHLIRLAQTQVLFKVVLKRPRLAPQCGEPHTSLRYTSCRFDLFNPMPTSPTTDKIQLNLSSTES